MRFGGFGESGQRDATHASSQQYSGDLLEYLRRSARGCGARVTHNRASLILHTNFNGVVITNQYELSNRLTNVISTDGFRVSYTYTEQNRLQALSLNRGDGSLLRSYTYGLDAPGHRISVLDSNLVAGARALLRGARYEYDFDPNAGALAARVHRLTQETLLGSDGNPAG